MPDFNDLTYLPLLTVRPAELRALQELPERDKDRLLPFFLLRPWGAAHQLQAALDKLSAVYGDRPFVLDLAPEEEPADTPRPVHEQLTALRDPANGYANWSTFIGLHNNFVPALQLADPAQFDLQAARLLDLERGLVVRFPRAALATSRLYAQRLGAITGGGDGICFVLDYERATRDLLGRQVEAVGLIQRILEVAPRATISIAASSFPDGFVGLESQEIFERLLFNGVRAQIGGEQLVYGDRGSARAERQLGGGGAPSPRIDYAMPLSWQFFRSGDGGARLAAYQALADEAIDSPHWDPALRLWGTQMIERTALGDPDAIISPVRATAARINIHLHRQLFYDDPPDALYETDEDWSD